MSKIIKELCEKEIKKMCQRQEYEGGEGESAEFIKCNEECEKIFNELSAELNKEQKKKLLAYHWAAVREGAQLAYEDSQKSAVTGFKLAVHLIIEALTE